MTRKLLVIILPFLILIFTPTVYAESVVTGSARTTTDTATLKLKQQMKLLEDQKKTAVFKINEEAKVAIQAKREEFKARIQTIKDEKKKALAQRIDAKLAEVNKAQTDRFSDVLVRLQGFLDKFEQSATGAVALKDIATAQAAIDAAKAAVETQAAKVYTMTVVDDSTLKANAGQTVSQLRLNLMAVYKLVIDAKQAVQKLNTTKSIIKKEATISAN